MRRLTGHPARRHNKRALRPRLMAQDMELLVVVHGVCCVCVFEGCPLWMGSPHEAPDAGYSLCGGGSKA